MAAPVTAPAARARIASTIESLHEEATRFFTALDGGGSFREDVWQRPGGGGGVSRVLAEGETFEKCGVNRSVVQGVMPPQMAQRLGARAGGEVESAFFVAGTSIVAHPRSPKVPTVHLNVRYFEVAAPDGTVLDAWFGGGTDLTPTYPYPEDAIHFHRALKATCDRHHPSFHARFKAWCDHYFVNLHRGEERRGVGGIFFDDLASGRFRTRSARTSSCPMTMRCAPAWPRSTCAWGTSSGRPNCSSRCTRVASSRRKAPRRSSACT